MFETGKSHAVLHRHLDGRGELLHVETKAFPITDSDDAVVAEHRRHGFRGRLTKPYAIDQLRVALAALLT